MANIWAQYDTDDKLEQEGIWMDFGDYSWLCKRAGGSNVKFKEAFARETKKVKQIMELEDLSDAQGREILIKVWADHVIMNWKNMVDSKGEKLPYTRANVVMIFTQLPDFFDKLRERLMGHSLFLKNMDEASIKK